MNIKSWHYFRGHSFSRVKKKLLKIYSWKTLRALAAINWKNRLHIHFTLAFYMQINLRKFKPESNIFREKKGKENMFFGKVHHTSKFLNSIEIRYETKRSIIYVTFCHNFIVMVSSARLFYYLGSQDCVQLATCSLCSVFADIWNAEHQCFFSVWKFSLRLFKTWTFWLARTCFFVCLKTGKDIPFCYRAY